MTIKSAMSHLAKELGGRTGILTGHPQSWASRMSDDEFRFARVSSGDAEVLWHVTQDGRFLGTIAEVGGVYQATLLALGGKSQTRLFAERMAAARWLATLAPGLPGTGIS